MKITKTFTRVIMFIVAMVMIMSPVLFSGCSWFSAPPSSQQPVVPQSGGTSGGGSGSGGSTGGDTNPSQTDSIYNPPEENLIDYEDYDEYFQNYRITYTPSGESDKSSFNTSIVNQNIEVANRLLLNLFKKYGSNTIVDDDYMLDGVVTNISVSINSENEKYLVYNSDNNSDNSYYIVKQTDDDRKFFTHKDSINNDSPSTTAGKTRKWNWNGEMTAFGSQSNQNKLQLAMYLILSGEKLQGQENDSGSFAQSYKSYFTDEKLQTIKDEFLVGDANNKTLNIESLSDVISKIDHSGFTKDELDSLKHFVLNYIIGTNLVSQDNKRFVNAYSTNGEDLHIVYNANSSNPSVKNGEYKKYKYNRFLTDECYATGELDGETLNFTISNGSQNLEGICYYAGTYLKSASKSNFGDFKLDGLTSSNGVNPSDITTNDVTSAVYNKLINAYGTTIDSNSNKKFNANVWNYDQNNDGIADETVQITVGDQKYSLFSIRLPYFKNYYNTVSFLIRDMFGDLTVEKKSQLDAEWQASKGIDYPYQSEFPNVPYVYFNDLDTKKMQLDEETGDIVMADSGYQAYQSLVVMPEKYLYLKEGIFFINGPRIEDPVEETFTMTLYARYYDAGTKTYATWDTEDGKSEFYKIETFQVEINSDPDDLDVEIDVDVRNILGTATINGNSKGNYLLDPFSEENERVNSQTLISKENYGYWFNQVSTPDNASVVCFDGKATNSPSYLEFVFYNPSGHSFVFTFTPDVCYFADNL